jgi:hypothetical protein
MPEDQTRHATEAPRHPDSTGDADSSGQADHKDKVKSGVATDVWLTLLPYPKDKKKRLCLRVNEKWRHLDYDEFIWRSVQSVFCSCTDTLEVVVWYLDVEIKGLVIRSKNTLAECD